MMIRGFTFLELLVVIGILGVAAAFVFLSADDEVDINRLILEAEKTANKFTNLIVKARSSQSTINLAGCGQTSFYARLYRGKKSNQLYTTGYVGTGAANVASGSSTSEKIYSFDARGTLRVSCPSGAHFITSDGNIVSSQSLPYVLTFYSTINPNVQARLEVSSLGYPRIYIRDTRIKNTLREVIR